MTLTKKTLLKLLDRLKDDAEIYVSMEIDGDDEPACGIAHKAALEVSEDQDCLVIYAEQGTEEEDGDDEEE